MTEQVETSIFASLAQNGPWALVAGWLLWTVIKAWSKDREIIMELLGDFRSSIDALRAAVERLGTHLDK